MDNKVEEIKKLLESAQINMVWHGYTTVWMGSNDKIAREICKLFQSKFVYDGTKYPIL